MFKRFSLKTIDDQLMEQGFKRITGIGNEEGLCKTIALFIEHAKKDFDDAELEFYIRVKAGKAYAGVKCVAYDRSCVK